MEDTFEEIKQELINSLEKKIKKMEEVISENKVIADDIYTHFDCNINEYENENENRNTLQS